MNTVLIIGAGDFQLPLIKRAAERFDVIVAAPVVPERFMPYVKDTLLCDVRDAEQILEFAKKHDIVGVITDQTDIPVRTVAYVAEKLGLPGNGIKTGELFTDKSLMRVRMEEMGIEMLPNRTVSTVEEALAFFNELGHPVILKPLDTQGSRGVTECRTADEVAAAFPDSARWSTNGKVIVEQLACGREFYLEGMVFDGHFQNLTIGDSDMFDIPNVWAARTRITPSNAPAELQRKVVELNKRIVEGFGLKQGITHSEFMTDGDGVYLIETAARGGGVYISSDQIHYRTGLDVEGFLLDIATGSITEPPAVADTGVACGYMAFYLPSGTVRRIEGMDEVKALPYVHRNQLDRIYEGLTIAGGPEDKTSRYAITVSGSSRDELLERMDGIRKMLKIEVEQQDGKVVGIIW